MALAGKGNEKIWLEGSLRNVINYLYCGAARFFDFSQKKVPLTNYSMYIFHAFRVLIPCMILSTKSLQIMPLKSCGSHINLELVGYVTA